MFGKSREEHGQSARGAREVRGQARVVYFRLPLHFVLDMACLLLQNCLGGSD